MSRFNEMEIGHEEVQDFIEAIPDDEIEEVIHNWIYNCVEDRGMTIDEVKEMMSNALDNIEHDYSF